MKKTFSVMSLALAAIIMAFTFTACLGGLNGTYVNEVSAFGATVTTTYKFEGDSYSHTTRGITTSGKFAVEDDKIYFWGENETREDANGTSFNKGSDNVGSYVEIGGIRYYKD